MALRVRGSAGVTDLAKAADNSAWATLSRSEMTSDIFTARNLGDVGWFGRFDFESLFELRISPSLNPRENTLSQSYPIR